MRPNALHSRWAQWSAPALFVALIFVLALTGCDFSGFEWDSLEGPCNPTSDCGGPSLPDAASAWSGDWTGRADVTYYGTDGDIDSTKVRNVDLEVFINPFEVEHIKFERTRRPSRYVNRGWDRLSEDSLRVVTESDTTETTFAFGTEEGGATGRVAVRDSGSDSPIRQVWKLDLHRPEN